MSLHKLNNIAVKNATEPGWYADGGGLYLRINKAGLKLWRFVYQWQKKRRELALGGVAQIGLATARKRAADYREQIAKGIDPGDHVSSKLRASEVEVITFGMIADEVKAKARETYVAKLRRLSPAPKSDGEIAEEKRKIDKRMNPWVLSLEFHCKELRSVPVADIDTDKVLDVLKPRWTKTPESADRTRSRIEAVLSAAAARKLRIRENPAQWRGHLEHLLPARPKLVKGHHPALDYADLPEFMARLEKREAMAGLALKFCILTTTRTTETLGAKWNEFHEDDTLWVVPPIRMKSPDGEPTEHRVPLSPQARQIIKDLRLANLGGKYVFPGQKSGRQLSEAAMTQVLHRMGHDNITVHGFRTSFKDWAVEETEFADHLSEMCLAHKVGSTVRRAYSRKDALARRREVMNAWALHAMSKTPEPVQAAYNRATNGEVAS